MARIFPPGTALLLALLVTPVHRGDGSPSTQPVSPASPSWRQVSLPEPARCAFDTPFSFFVRESAAGPTARLLIYFEGGGACWDWVTCSGTFDSSVEPDELSDYRGIFDFANPANPFQDFTTVFIPYCTGDVHIGAVTRRYGNSSTRPIRHNGYPNVRAVLEWMARRQYAPPEVVTAGTSAGSYGALFMLPAIARIYPRARMVLIGDSGVPLLPDYPAILRAWGAESPLREIRRSPAPPDGTELTLERAHREAASAAGPRGAVTLVMSDQDAIQSAFYLIAGSPRWRADAYRLLDRLGRTEPSFRDFIVSGSEHGLLNTDRFYGYGADGISLREWVARLVEGLPVTDRRCEACRGE